MVQLLLNFVVFISGAVLMSLEIVGSRVLAPYFGSSIFVWGSLISVVMAALSIGYYWGGWLSAREPSYGKLLDAASDPRHFNFLSAVHLSNGQRLDRRRRFRQSAESAGRVQRALSFAGSISGHDLALTSIRLGRDPISTVGSTAGTLYAVSTCGSIFGTLLTAFYLIPVLGVSNIIHALGITLACFCRWL